MAPASVRTGSATTDPRGEPPHPSAFVLCIPLGDKGRTPNWPDSQSDRFRAMDSAEKVCIIGAGGSGIVAAQVLDAKGIPFHCFEKGSQIGGNWRFENDNGMSSAYRSLHINTSRRVMAFNSLPTD